MKFLFFPRIFVVIFFLFSLFSPQPIQAVTYWMSLKNGASAAVYIPDSLDLSVAHPLLMALHGMRQTPEDALDVWKSVSNELGMILICPKGSDFLSGYTEAPEDDCMNNALFFSVMSMKYKIDKERSVIAGFSRGGNFAIGTALQYPAKFRNVICIFGFFVDKYKEIASYNLRMNSKIYRDLRFHFITGHGDQTQASQEIGHSFLQSYQILSTIRVFPNLIHDFPPGLADEIQHVQLSRNRLDGTEWRIANVQDKRTYRSPSVKM